MTLRVESATEPWCDVNGEAIVVRGAERAFAVFEGNGGDLVRIATEEFSSAAVSGEPLEHALHRADRRIRESVLAAVRRERESWRRTRLARAIHFLSGRRIWRSNICSVIGAPVQVAAMVFDEAESCATIAQVGGACVYRLRDTLVCLSEYDSHRNGFGSDSLRWGLGAEERQIIDIVQTDVRPGDTFVLCTDGLSHNVSPSNIERALRSEPQRAHALLRMATTAPDWIVDDVTVVIIDVMAGDPP